MDSLSATRAADSQQRPPEMEAILARFKGIALFAGINDPEEMEIPHPYRVEEAPDARAAAACMRVVDEIARYPTRPGIYVGDLGDTFLSTLGECNRAACRLLRELAEGRLTVAAQHDAQCALETVADFFLWRPFEDPFLVRRSHALVESLVLLSERRLTAADAAEIFTRFPWGGLWGSTADGVCRLAALEGALWRLDCAVAELVSADGSLGLFEDPRAASEDVVAEAKAVSALLRARGLLPG